MSQNIQYIPKKELKKTNNKGKNIEKSELEIKEDNRKRFNAKMSDIKGHGFEELMQYTISNKFFLEDLRVENLPNINDVIFTNPSFEIKEIRDDILLKLTVEPGSQTEMNIKRIKFQNEFNNNLVEYFGKQEYYNSIYKAPSEYYSTHIDENDISGNSKKPKEKPKNKAINNKDISEVEFNLFMKKIESKKLIDYLNEMNNKKRAFEMIHGDDIKEGEFFNLCFEITIQSKDVIEKKIPQLYKFISFFNFMYKLNEFFDNEKYSDEERSLLSSSKGYFVKKAKIFDFKYKIVILLVCDGIREDFDELQKKIQNLKNEPKNNSFKTLKQINENNYNIFLVYYPIYDPADKIYKMMENLESELKEIKAENKYLKFILNKSFVYSKKKLTSSYPFKKK